MKHVVLVDPDGTCSESVTDLNGSVEVAGVDGYHMLVTVKYRVFELLDLPAARPYVLVLPTLIASSFVLNLAMEQTGPKISSCIIFMSSVTLEKMVGSMK